MKKQLLILFVFAASIVGAQTTVPQKVTGTVTAIASGTQAISGTVSVPSGTVTITGTPTITQSTATLALTSSTVSSSGTVTAGARAVMIETGSTFVGTIDGFPATASTIYSFSGSQYLFLPAIPYAISAGTITIRKLN